MAIFQKSVLNKFINGQDKLKIDNAYRIFSDLFFDEKRQSEIRLMKEEEYQDGFLDDLFVKVLGYIKRPDLGYNLVREKKNEADSKKADGAILKNDKPIAVIELKGTNTKDLDKITKQGFEYKVNHKECMYVITSNFQKLRFYIEHAAEYLEFNLSSLTKEEFIILWVCLHPDNLIENIPLKIKSESVVKEEDITKKLYKDYSSFKQELWQNIVALNPNGDPLMFYKKTQKLIDRFLFIFFAEDAGLLPPNSISRMVDRWKMLKDEDAYKPLYDIFKQYFGYINTGRPGKTPQDEIFAYNGGLMLEDDVLESISIDDEILLKHVSKLTSYDFSSEVDVNILGHIFENSLNDIEAVTAELEGQEIDKSKTKRKKDGVFYTPKYITKYIVENTVGKLCQEKKTELNIIDEEYVKGRTNHKKENLKKLDQNLQDYRNWLLQITICDPACGSGAFLNQALEFLMEEHQYIDELESKLLGSGFKFPGVENHILENNIFGVDINEESVEIAKLSLWLRTAQRGRKLTSLNNNIKCGNSLIDDIDIAGNKAFNWQLEFPSVFIKGGFDVVIGNPPYVNIYNMLNTDREYFNNSNQFPSTHLKYDLYVLFFDLGLNILKQNGYLSYIIPSVLLTVPYGTIIRKNIIENFTLNQIVDFTGFKVFADAMVESCILGIKKSSSDRNSVSIYRPTQNIYDFIDNKNEIHQNQFLQTESFQFRIDLNSKIISIVEKLKLKSVSIESIYYVSKGIVAFSKVDNRKKEDFLFATKIDDKCKEYLEGKDVDRYKLKFNNKYLQYDEKIMSRPTFPELQNHPKLLIRAISDGLNATFDETGFFVDQKLIICSKRFIIDKYIAPAKRPKAEMLDKKGLANEKATLSLMNSSLFCFYYNKILKGGVSVLPEDIRNFPTYLFQSESEQNPFIEKADLMLKFNIDLQEQSNKFINLLKSDFNLEKPSKKIEEFYLLDWADFNKELQKNKITLLGVSKDDWFDRFDRFKKQALELISQIDQTDTQIDRMVYEIYGLSDDEIQIVENS
jgi:type I restriction-modification system DNA methylase subunit